MTAWKLACYTDVSFALAVLYAFVSTIAIGSREYRLLTNMTLLRTDACQQ